MNDSNELLENRKFAKGLMVFGAIASTVIGAVVLIYYVMKVSESHSLPLKDQTINLTGYGAFGDFIGGAVGTLFSLGGFFLLYLTLKDQRENFDRERLENNFFEMIKLHRDNISEMKYTYYENEKEDSKVTAEQRKVFKLIFVQFKEAWSELSHLFEAKTAEDIYNAGYLVKLQQNSELTKRAIDLKQFAQIDIVYLIVFFGLSREDQQSILNLCSGKYQEQFVRHVLQWASLKPKRESIYFAKWQMVETDFSEIKARLFQHILNKREDPAYEPKLITNWVVKGDRYFQSETFFYPDEYNKYYGGHQFRLGHYYRHIFQTVCFIDEEKYLSRRDKYKYIKILRGQLSNYEQLVFLLNSLSAVGRTWELVNKDTPEKSILAEKQLITNYNLVKNIPSRYIAGHIDITMYYPGVKYEAITPGPVEQKTTTS